MTGLFKLPVKRGAPYFVVNNIERRFLHDLKHATLLSRCGSDTCYMMYGHLTMVSIRPDTIKNLYVKIIRRERINHSKFKLHVSRILPVSIIFVGEGCQES